MLHGVREVGFLAPFPDLCPKEFAAVCYWIACSKLKGCDGGRSGSVTSIFSLNLCFLGLCLFLNHIIFNFHTTAFVSLLQELHVYLTSLCADLSV